MSQARPLEPLLPSPSAQDLSQKCISAINGSLTCLCIALGHNLGLYAALKRLGPTSSQDLATAVDLSERWVREWLYQQAAAELISTDKQAQSFWMTEAQADLLVEAPTLEEAKESPLEMVLMMPTILSKMDHISSCFKTGIGLTFDVLGTEHMCYTHRHARGLQLERRIETLPGLTQKLQEGIKVADVGCGSGENLLHLASVFPNSTFVGYDISQHALSLANRRKAERGLTNVMFLNPQDGLESRLPCEPTYHLVLVQEAVHDMINPQEMLKFIRQSMLSSSHTPSSRPTEALPSTAAADTIGHSTQQQDALTGYNGDPVLLVTDIQSQGNPAGNISKMPIASMLYGISVAVCMSSALSEPGGAGLGTVGFHEDVAREMSAAAGFSRFSKLEGDGGMGFSAHYMLRP